MQAVSFQRIIICDQSGSWSSIVLSFYKWPFEMDKHEQQKKKYVITPFSCRVAFNENNMRTNGIAKVQPPWCCKARWETEN